jgi:hypothetical protein
MAAVLACGPDALLSRGSAAALHELRQSGQAKIDVTVPGSHRRAHDNLRIHSSALHAEDVLTFDHIPVTSAPAPSPTSLAFSEPSSC